MPADASATLRRLTVIVAIQWMGATLGLPLLPLFLEHRGGTPHIIGLIVSSFFLAGMATQFALGHLTDRFGRRRVLVAGLVAYGIASMCFVLPVTAPWFTLARVVQGASAGAIEVASLAAVAALVPEAERGRAISRVLAAQLLGIAIGPMIGALSSVGTLGWAFFAAGIVSLVAAFVAARSYLGSETVHTEPLPPVRWNRQLVGALFAAAAAGASIGVYETCWSLLLHSHHATTLQIRLSWTVFCIPWVVLSRVGGWIADHWNRRAASLAGLLNMAGFLMLYPHIHNNVVILFVGSTESIGAALTTPSISSLLTQGAHDREFGRRQGLYATSQTSTLALVAASSGFLFTLNPALPFTLVGIMAASLGLTTLWWWRGLRGRIQPADA